MTMEKTINTWKGWRLEFEQEYGSDMDGAAEYSSYSEFDWSAEDIATIISKGYSSGFSWIRYCNSRYSEIYIEKATAEEIHIHFTDTCTHCLTKEKREWGYGFAFGHGTYHDTIRLLPPGEKEEETAKYLK